ncbi:hypothetical protein QZH41_001914 [Actinostola sp. cb2023]|nr:hypothetical protein QZH41_001914 [Actinostola sp. cb2023]
MEELESRLLATFTNPPSLYGRYVDDTICVIQKDQINALHQHLDSQDPNIKFTVERYSDDGLPFLDTLNKVLDDGTIDVSIFRKKTHTDRYLHFSSHHPPQHKAAVVRTLVHKTNNLLSKDCHKDKERTHIGRALAANGYPRQFIHRFSQDRKIAEKKSDTEERKGFALLPYVQGTTERIKRVLESHRIEVCVKPLTTLRHILSKPKDPLPKEKKTGVIYSIPCGECETFYIGETGRSLATRQKEHQSYVRLNKTNKSALAEHAHNTGHSISWNNTKILEVETRWHQRKWSEACHIAKSTDAISNRDTGRILPQNYTALFKKF